MSNNLSWSLAGKGEHNSAEQDDGVQANNRLGEPPSLARLITYTVFINATRAAVAGNPRWKNGTTSPDVSYLLKDNILLYTENSPSARTVAHLFAWFAHAADENLCRAYCTVCVFCVAAHRSHTSRRWTSLGIATLLVGFRVPREHQRSRIFQSCTRNYASVPPPA